MDRRKFFTVIGGVTIAGVATKMTFDAVADSEPSNKTGTTQKRWAMVVDLKKCMENGGGCDKCIKACHKTHNVPEIADKEEEIHWIWKDRFQNAFISQENELLPKRFHDKQVLMMCNHCDNPPCTNVCPTKATWKRESDGIVMMDWHRCVGCRYCVAACPYGSRSFNWREPQPLLTETNVDFPARTRGVVEKCTFCAELIAQDKLPACVQACTAGALVFGDLKDPESNIRKLLEEHYSIRRKPALGTQPEVYYLV